MRPIIAPASPTLYLCTDEARESATHIRPLTSDDVGDGDDDDGTPAWKWLCKWAPWRNLNKVHGWCGRLVEKETHTAPNYQVNDGGLCKRVLSELMND